MSGQQWQQGGPQSSHPTMMPFFNMPRQARNTSEFGSRPASLGWIEYNEYESVDVSDDFVRIERSTHRRSSVAKSVSSQKLRHAARPDTDWIDDGGDGDRARPGRFLAAKKVQTGADWNRICQIEKLPRHNGIRLYAACSNDNIFKGWSSCSLKLLETNDEQVPRYGSILCTLEVRVSINSNTAGGRYT